MFGRIFYVTLMKRITSQNFETILLNQAFKKLKILRFKKSKMLKNYESLKHSVTVISKLKLSQVENIKALLNKSSHN